MPWNNQSGGGGWKSGGGNGGGPWGQGPSGGGGQPPDLEEMLKRGQDKVKQVMHGGGVPGPLLFLVAVVACAVIGGTAVFTAALPVATRIYKTEVHGVPQGDAFFPAIDWDDWQEATREALPRGPHDDFDATLLVIDRRAT